MQKKFELTLQKIKANDPSLTSLSLIGQKIGVAGVTKLKEALKTNTTLTFINLYHNDIRNKGAKYLSEALKNNITVTSVSLRDNKIGARGVKYLSETLKTNTILSLDLGLNKIGDVGVKELSKTLSINTSLTFLNLMENQIGVAGAKYLSEALKTNTSLTSLNLWTNKIGAAGAEDLSTALLNNTKLTFLCLQGNEIGAAGAKDLSKVLKINTSLTCLNLQYNQIGDEGAKDLSNALKTNTNLASLNLQSNQIGAAGARDLSEALKTNFTMLHLDFTGDLRIKRYCRRNNDIASSLKPITYFMEDAYELDGKDLEAKLLALDKIIYYLEAGSESLYLKEGYRLLTVLAFMANQGSEMDALQALLLPLTQHNFQKSACFALAKLLCGDISLKLSHYNTLILKAKSLLILQGFKEHLHQPELLQFAYIALFELLNPGQKMLFNDFDNLKNATALISQKLLWALIKSTLIHCQTGEKTNSFETELLEMLSQQQVYHPLAALFLMRSPAFIAEFKKEYPKAVSFTLPEHCLFSGLALENSFLIEVPNGVVPIQESLMNEYATALSLYKAHASRIDFLKEVIASALFPLTASTAFSEVKDSKLSEPPKEIQIMEKPIKESQLGPYSIFFHPLATVTSSKLAIPSQEKDSSTELSNQNDEGESNGLESRPGF